MKTALPKMGLITLLIIFTLDQLTKLVVVSKMQLGESIPLAKYVYFTYVLNPGGAFSLMADAPFWIRRPLLLLVPLAALWLAYKFWQELPSSDKLSELALGLIAGGALGNFLDRLRLGEVIDFMHVDIPLQFLLAWVWESAPYVYTWPIFNVADSAVLIGIALLAYRTFKGGQGHAPHPA